MITKVKLNVVRNWLVAKSGAFKRFTIQVFAFKALWRRNRNTTNPRHVHVNNLPLSCITVSDGIQFRLTPLRLKNNLTYALPSIFQDVLDLFYLVLVQVTVISKDRPDNFA